MFSPPLSEDSAKVLRIAIVAADPSGDNLAADLIEEMNSRSTAVRFFGICGPAMVKAGAQSIYSIDDISSLGIEGLFGRLRKIFKVRKHILSLLLSNPPDVFVGVDAPDFNLSLEYKLRKAGIATLQYVGPTVWAWRSYRIRKLKQAVQHLLTIYPFESQLMESACIPYTYIGHPLADKMNTLDRREIRSRLDIDEAERVVVLMPGSRLNEVSRLGAVLLETASKMVAVEPNLRFIVPFANDETYQLFRQQLCEANLAFSVDLTTDDSLQTIATSDVVVAASGTAALEAALLAKPVVVCYRLSKLSYWMVRMLSNTKYYCMLNHFQPEPLVPEFLQHQCTADNLSQEALRLLNNADYREKMLVGFEKIEIQLRQNANVLAVDEILKLAQKCPN